MSRRNLSLRGSTRVLSWSSFSYLRDVINWDSRTTGHGVHLVLTMGHFDRYSMRANFQELHDNNTLEEKFGNTSIVCTILYKIDKKIVTTRINLQKFQKHNTLEGKFENLSQPLSRSFITILYKIEQNL